MGGNHGPFGIRMLAGDGGGPMAAGGAGAALPWRMADTNEEAAELRISRVKALDERDLTGLLTYLLARYPDTFPAMLDEALSTLSPKAD